VAAAKRKPAVVVEPCPNCSLLQRVVRDLEYELEKLRDRLRRRDEQDEVQELGIIQETDPVILEDLEDIDYGRPFPEELI
jgi:hypothetical protein